MTYDGYYYEPDYTCQHDNPGPSVQELEADVTSGRRCVECQTLFTKKHNHAKTLCAPCGRLFIETRGYHLATHREQSSEAHAARNRKKKRQLSEAEGDGGAGTSE